MANGPSGSPSSADITHLTAMFIGGDRFLAKELILIPCFPARSRKTALLLKVLVSKETRFRLLVVAWLEDARVVLRMKYDEYTHKSTPQASTDQHSRPVGMKQLLSSGH